MSNMHENGVVLFGWGGHGRAVAEVLRRLHLAPVVMVDPRRPSDEGSIELLETDQAGIEYARRHGLGAVIAIGNNRRRLELAREARRSGVQLPPLVAPTATVSGDAVVGYGTVVLEHAHVGSAAALGSACIVNTGAIVEHGSELGDGVHCAPGSVLAADVRCGERSLVGARAVVLPRVTVGPGATVGAGAVAVLHVEAGSTVIGVPARPLHRKHTIAAPGVRDR